MYVYDNESAIELSGDVDLTSSGILSLLEKKLHGREAIVFDVAGLEHVDSTFLRFLVRLKQHAAKGELATVTLIGVRPNLRRILEITGLARMFSLEPRVNVLPRALRPRC
jgi:anti-anti-sigma factor